VPVSLTETFFLAVKTRLELILSDTSYSLNSKLRSVQLSTYRLAGEQVATNTLLEPTIIVSDLGSEDDSTVQVDTWERSIRGMAWYTSGDDGDLVSMIRAYEDMLRALNPAELPDFTLARYSRSYADPFTQESLPGVILTFEGTYHSSLSDPSTE